MIQSMTGYGQAVCENALLCVTVEIKSINSKHADISWRAPKELNMHELEWRNQVTKQLVRGKITVAISYELIGLDTTPMIDTDNFERYYRTLHELATSVGASSPALFQLALQGPNITVPAHTTLAPEILAPIVTETLQDAIAQCTMGRKQEGEALAAQLLACLQKIKEGLERVTDLAPKRMAMVREKLHTRLKEMALEADEQRIAQEIVFYLERQDIAEEQIRLAQHLTYFEETMNSAIPAGKKLGFIAQEIGREINTIGSKANDGAIQQEVILMKDELEKIKEQLHNIL